MKIHAQNRATHACERHGRNTRKHESWAPVGLVYFIIRPLAASSWREDMEYVILLDGYGMGMAMNEYEHEYGLGDGRWGMEDMHTWLGNMYV